MTVRLGSVASTEVHTVPIGCCTSLSAVVYSFHHPPLTLRLSYLLLPFLSIEERERESGERERESVG